MNNELTPLEQKIYEYIKKEKEVPYYIIFLMFNTWIFHMTEDYTKDIDIIGNSIKTLKEWDLIECNNETHCTYYKGRK